MRSNKLKIVKTGDIVIACFKQMRSFLFVGF